MSAVVQMYMMNVMFAVVMVFLKVSVIAMVASWVAITNVTLVGHGMNVMFVLNILLEFQKETVIASVIH